MRVHLHRGGVGYGDAISWQNVTDFKYDYHGTYQGMQYRFVRFKCPASGEVALHLGTGDTLITDEVNFP